MSNLKFSDFRALPNISVINRVPFVTFSIKLKLSQKYIGAICNAESPQRPKYYAPVLEPNIRLSSHDFHRKCYEEFVVPEYQESDWTPPFSDAFPDKWPELLSDYFQARARTQLIARLEECNEHNRRYVSTRYYSSDADLLTLRYFSDDFIRSFKENLLTFSEDYNERILKEAVLDARVAPAAKNYGRTLRRIGTKRNTQPVPETLPPWCQEAWDEYVTNYRDIPESNQRAMRSSLNGFRRAANYLTERKADYTVAEPLRGRYVWEFLLFHHASMSLPHGGCFEYELTGRDESKLIRPQMPSLRELWNVYLTHMRNIEQGYRVPRMSELYASTSHEVGFTAKRHEQDYAVALDQLEENMPWMFE